MSFFLSGAAFMTEGMACPPNTTECEFVMNELDKSLMSWTDYGDSQGSIFGPDTRQQRSWARTFARAVAGMPLNMTFDSTTKEFSFCFAMDLSVKAPTELFASRAFSYPNGTSVALSSNLVQGGNSSSPDVLLIFPAPDAKDGSDACVKIKAN